MFEKATREKYRFPYMGALTVEQLWDLPLEDLDDLYGNLSEELKKSGKPSLLKEKTVDNEVLEDKIAITEHIIKTRQAELEFAQKAAQRKQTEQKIMEIIAKKQDASLEEKSIDELKELLEKL